MPGGRPDPAGTKSPPGGGPSSTDPDTDPRSELSVPILVDGAVWGVLNIEGAERDAFAEADVVLVEASAASLGSALHRARLVAELEGAFSTTLPIT